jgi:hypothetical protein
MYPHPAILALVTIVILRRQPKNLGFVTARKCQRLRFPQNDVFARIATQCPEVNSQTSSESLSEVELFR